jgi:glycerol uptake facilitator-like aquaporin
MSLLKKSQGGSAVTTAWLPACIAEGLGTFGLVFAGCGAIIIDRLSSGQITHVGVGLVFGLILTAMMYATGHISGAHLNPTVTLGFVLARHIPVGRLMGYWCAQLIGAIAAAACLRLLFGNVAHLGATIPTGSGGAWQSFWLEALLTFFLMFVIMAVATDTRAVGQAAALAIGATVWAGGALCRTHQRRLDESGALAGAGARWRNLDSSVDLSDGATLWSGRGSADVPLAAGGESRAGHKMW